MVVVRRDPRHRLLPMQNVFQNGEPARQMEPIQDVLSVRQNMELQAAQTLISIGEHGQPVGGRTLLADTVPNAVTDLRVVLHPSDETKAAG